MALSDRRPVVLAQISDTHLSDRNALFRGNFDVIMDAVERVSPDLVINTGDLSLNGSDQDDDLIYAMSCLRSRRSDMLVLPGNHDLGEALSNNAKQTVNEQRLERYARLVGESGWHRDIPGWRLIGINSQTLELDGAEGSRQASMISEAVKETGSRKLCLASHLPLADRAYDEGHRAQWFLSPEARARLFLLLGERWPDLVLSGHVHQARESHFGGTRHIWAPATSFIVNERWQSTFGVRQIGYALHRFFADGRHEAEFCSVAGTVQHDIYDHPTIYGP